MKLVTSAHPFTCSKIAFALAISVLLAAPARAASSPSANWKDRVVAAMPLLGHRNWILVVDSAYPLQSSPGVETIESNANQLDVTRFVLSAIDGSIHVRPLIFMDAELPFVPDSDAPGASAYRTQIGALLHAYQIQSLPHERVIRDINEAGSTFHVLIVKTNMTIPYTSVFIRLDCKYWPADAESRMRVKMNAAGVPSK